MRALTSVKVVLVGLGFTLAATGCRGKMIATAELHGAGTADAHFKSTGGPLVLWADTDGKWRGGRRSHLPAHYEIDVRASGKHVGHVSCDTQNASTSVCGSTVAINDLHSGDCEVKLTCALPTIPAGDATLHVTATLGANAMEVRKMSINVRDP